MNDLALLLGKEKSLNNYGGLKQIWWLAIRARGLKLLERNNKFLVFEFRTQAT